MSANRDFLRKQQAFLNNPGINPETGGRLVYGKGPYNAFVLLYGVPLKGNLPLSPRAIKPVATRAVYVSPVIIRPTFYEASNARRPSSPRNPRSSSPSRYSNTYMNKSWNGNNVDYSNNQLVAVPSTIQTRTEQVGGEFFDPDPTVYIYDTPAKPVRVNGVIGNYGPGGARSVVSGVYTPPATRTYVTEDILEHPVVSNNTGRM